MKIAGGQEINTLFIFNISIKSLYLPPHVNTGTYKTTSLLQNYKTK